MLKHLYKYINLKYFEKFNFLKNFYYINIVQKLSIIENYLVNINIKFQFLIKNIQTQYTIYQPKINFLYNFIKKQINNINTIKTYYILIILIFLNRLNIDITNITNTLVLSINKLGSLKLFVLNFHYFIPKINGLEFLCPFVQFQNFKNSFFCIYIDTLLISLPFITLFLFFFYTSINFFNKKNFFFNKNKKFFIFKKSYQFFKIL